MTVANTLAYYDTAIIMTAKSLIVQVPGGCFDNTSIPLLLIIGHNKLESLSLSNLSSLA
jgi:hypothetical protein